ncbi:AI-2E family transporter [Erythrobacter sp.]|uniref:AI-2E family transporter n=1 Tax=Erythrobacter sp. TaxID=1042 RepID=UPI003C70B56C
MSDKSFIRRVGIVLALCALAFLAWQLRSVLLLVFGSVLVAVMFRALAAPICRWTGMGEKPAVGLAVLLVVGLLVLAGWLFGAEVRAQVLTLVETVPQAWQSFELRIGDSDLGEELRTMGADAAPSGGSLLSGFAAALMSFGTGLADAFVVVVGGIYLALQPRLYREGLLKLFPAERRDLIDNAVGGAGRALRLWLGGQLVSMTVIGLLTGFGLYLIGVPSAVALGLLAGFLEFIPLIGPVIAAVPALLIALAIDPQLALWTLLLYLVIQQIEGNLLQPVVQQFAVDLPAVILLFSILAFGTLFGIVGILLAAPLAVLVYTLITRLYVREALDTPVSMPGEDEDQPDAEQDGSASR